MQGAGMGRPGAGGMVGWCSTKKKQRQGGATQRRGGATQDGRPLRGLVWREEELGFGITRGNDNAMLNILLLSFIHHLNPNEGVIFIEHT